jgi:hypothetical protein
VSKSGNAQGRRKKKRPFGVKGLGNSGSPDVTLFITVLVLPLLTENLQYQRVIKDQAVPGEAEAALTRISSLCLTITRFHGLFPDFLTS